MCIPWCCDSLQEVARLPTKINGALNWIEFQTLKKAPQGPIVIEAESWDDQKNARWPI